MTIDDILHVFSTQRLESAVFYLWEQIARRLAEKAEQAPMPAGFSGGEEAWAKLRAEMAESLRRVAVKPEHLEWLQRVYPEAYAYAAAAQLYVLADVG